jgi:hypothetical protein
MTFSDTGKSPILFYLGETGNSGLLAGGGRPLPGWCSVSVESGKLVFWLEGLGRKIVDVRAAQLVNLPGALKTDSGGLTLQTFSAPFEDHGALCCFVTHFRGTWQGGSSNDNTRDLFLLSTPFAADGATPQPTPTPVPQPVPAPTPLDGQVLAKLDQLVKMLDDDWNAAMKPTVLGVARIEQLLADQDRSFTDALVRLNDRLGAFWTAPPAADGYNLPPEIAGALGRESQQAIALAVGAVLEWALLEAGYPNAEARRFTVAPGG